MGNLGWNLYNRLNNNLMHNGRQRQNSELKKRLKDWTDTENGEDDLTQAENAADDFTWPEEAADSGTQTENGVRAGGSLSYQGEMQFSENGSGSALQQAVIWTEILGEPVSRKRRKKRMSR